MILCIETSTKNCSVALFDHSGLIASKEESDSGFSHGEKLHVFIEELFLKAGRSKSELKAVAVSMGPGSYTGLRIGVSAAKGISFALDIPMIAIPTLDVIAAQAELGDWQRVVAVLDARRMEVYRCIYDQEHNVVEPTAAEVIDSESFKKLERFYTVVLGNCVSKIKEVVNSSNIHFMQDSYPSALQMGKMALRKFDSDDFVDTAYFEPYYLKDFIVTPSKK